MKRAYQIGLVIYLLARIASADGKRPVSLSVTDVKTEVKPFEAEIQRCYLDHAADVRGAGKLDLVFTVDKHGTIDSLVVQTPGLTAKLSKKIDACVQATVATVTFPARRTFTTATVPYFFLHTDAPHSGPQLSCWDPKGCR